jgi:hypothetical protein
LIEQVSDQEVLEGPAEAIGTLRIPVDSAALAQVLGLRDRLDALIADVVGEFDAMHLWDVDAATSMGGSAGAAAPLDQLSVATDRCRRDGRPDGSGHLTTAIGAGV